MAMSLLGKPVKTKKQATAIGHKKSLPVNQSTLFNQTLLTMINQRTNKLKQIKNNNQAARSKSACRGKAELFNSTAPIKFFTNLEENMRESIPLHPVGGLNPTQKELSDKLTINQSMQFSQVNMGPPQGSMINNVNLNKPRKLGSEMGHVKSNSVTSKHLTQSYQVQSKTMKNKGYHSTANTSTRGSSNQVAAKKLSKVAMSQNRDEAKKLAQAVVVGNKQVNLNKKMYQASSQHSSKIKLSVNHHKTRSTSSLSQGKDSTQGTLTVQSQTIGKLNKKMHESKRNQDLNTFGLNKNITLTHKSKNVKSSQIQINQNNSYHQNAQLKTNNSATNYSLKKKQTLRGLLETQKAINNRGSSVPNSSTKVKQQAKTYQSSQSNAQYKQNFTENPGFNQTAQVHQASDLSGNVAQSSQNSITKVSSSMKQLQPCKKQLNASCVQVNGYNQVALGVPSFSRVDFERINPLPANSALSKPNVKGSLIQQKFTKKQYGELNSNHGTASGPLNPFLEQILKELPSASIVSASQGNSAACTGLVPIQQWLQEEDKQGEKVVPRIKRTRKSVSRQTISSSSKSGGPTSKGQNLNYTMNLSNKATVRGIGSQMGNNTHAENSIEQDSVPSKFNISKKLKSKSKFQINKTRNDDESLENLTNSLVAKKPELAHKQQIQLKRYKIVRNSSLAGTAGQAQARYLLQNVVKMAARQKENALANQLNTSKVRDRSKDLKTIAKKTGLSLNNTQMLADQLVALQQSKPINPPQKHQKKQSVVEKPRDKSKSSTVSNTVKRNNQRSNSGKQNNQLSQPQVNQRKSNSSQFDWNGFLANLHQENLKLKKSTAGVAQAYGYALQARPCQLQQELRNKTQPLPKNLIGSDSNERVAKTNHYGVEQQKPTPYGNNSGIHFPDKLNASSRGSEYRPKVGRKQIEIAPPNGPGTVQNLAATLQTNQLTGVAEAVRTEAVLTEVTDSGTEGEKDTSSASAPSTHRSPEKVNQEYKFGRLLGEGAYAAVRIAYKKSEGKTYAAKIYDKAKLTDEHRRSSVCREVMLLQKLKHKYVVEFTEAFETDHHVYVIMEHVQGRSLHDHLKKQRASNGKTEFDQTLCEEETKRIIKQLLEVLEYLHGQGITHRDIKLENVLLDKEGNVKLIDFGFSTCFTPQKKIKMFCGTPSYMAPEIVSRVEYYGPPADIWATGVLFFCLLNGFFPFKGHTDAELYRRINRGSFNLIRSDLTAECISLLKEMLCVNADNRQTAGELLQENWFLTDQSKKRSHSEIKRQFKAKILNKFPIRNVNKNTICIPVSSGVTTVINKKEATRPQSSNKSMTSNESQQSKRYSEPNSNSNSQPVQSNTQQTVISQASPPSCVGLPDHRQPKPPNPVSLQLNSLGHLPDSCPDAINQEALLAYYNTTSQAMHNTVSGIAPPSGKYTPYNAYNQSSNAQGEKELLAFEDTDIQKEDHQEDQELSSYGTIPANGQ